ncbi:MAG: hypothetical protein ACOCXZ_02005 [Chloroflexota bacterium]
MPRLPEALVFLLVALVGAVWAINLSAQPGYTDAYYYFNAAERLVRGDGLTDLYIWTYTGLPDDAVLPVPSHLYWMPLTSLIAAGGMALFNAPGDYSAAQSLFLLLLLGLSATAYGLGHRLGGTWRHRWLAGLLTLFSGFFVRFWGQTDNFLPYALPAALTLVALGLVLHLRRSALLSALAAGVFAGLGHLARADGLLLLLVGWGVILWPWSLPRVSAGRRLSLLIVITMGYLVIMGPWMLRTYSVTGALLPVGGLDAVWFRTYDALFNYPPGASPADLFADGIGPFLETRLTALVNNTLTFIAVEGMVVLAPLALIALWKRRRDRFLAPFWLYALGLHLVMTVVFPLPGYRGGLFHSAAALLPFWMALGVCGLDDAVDWMARRRRNWRPQQAKRVFSAGLLALALALALSIGASRRTVQATPALMQQLVRELPAGAVVMINDPAQLYYFTGLSGVVIPNAPVDVVPEIARRFGVTHLVVETAGAGLAVPRPFDINPEALPDFLRPVDVSLDGALLYAVNP